MPASMDEVLLRYGIRIPVSLPIAGKVELGSPINIGPGCALIDVRLGAFTYLTGSSTLRRAAIGRYCSVASGVTIGPEQHATDGLTTSPFPYNNQKFGFYNGIVPAEKWDETDETLIGHDVWIGQDALIMGGVSVGDGAIVAARAVVTRDVEPFSIVAGVPARVIRHRFESQVARAISELQWWNYDIPNWLASNREQPSRPLTTEFLDKLRDDIEQHRVPPISNGTVHLALEDGRVNVTAVRA